MKRSCRRTDFEVAIIGCGPSGCSTALTLAARGHSAVLIASPRQWEKPTETSAPALRSVLQALDATELLNECEPCYGISSTWGNPTPIFRSSVLNPNGHAWFVHRTLFDKKLLERTKARGVTEISASISCLEIGGDKVLFTTDDGSHLSAEWVVLAKGSQPWSARVTGQKPRLLDRLVAFWSFLPGTFQNGFYPLKTKDYGWWYTCPSLWRRTICLSCFRYRNLTKALNALPSKVWRKLFLEKNKLGADYQFANLRPVLAAATGLAELPLRHGHRWVAIGDAAMMLDPFASGNITALDSGLRAGKAISEALNGNFDTLHEYQQWSSGLFRSFAFQRN